MATDLLYNEEARTAIGKGMDKLANAVKITLGPRGRNVVFDQKYDVPLVTNDGVTIAKQVELENIFENLGASFLKQAAIKTNEAAGDGTTAAIVLAGAIVNEGIKNVVAGANPIILKNGIMKASQTALDEITKMSVPVDQDMLKQIAMISGNNDEFIGDMVADAFDKVGFKGVVTVEDSQLPETKLKYANGIRFEKGYQSELFITNSNSKTAELTDPYILCYEGDVRKFSDIINILEQIVKQNASLLIIATDIKEEALQTLALNVSKGVLKAAAVIGPGYGDTRKRNLKAIATMTGATVISSEAGLKLESCGLEVCGKADRAVIGKEETVIQSPANANSEDANVMYRQVKATLDTTKEDYEIEKLNVTLSLLTGGLALITVGGTSELEMFERKYRMEDAINAVYAAIEGGVVPGGGKALLLAIPAVEKLIETLEGDEKTGAKIIKEALSAPIKQIAENAGVDGSVVLDTVLRNGEVNFGYNALMMEYGDMIKFGIIDPAKVIKSSLANATSVAEMLLTTDAGVADPKGPKSDREF